MDSIGGYGVGRFWGLLLLGAPLWWLLGFNFFIYHLASFFLLLRFSLQRSRSGSGLFFPPAFRFLLLYAVIYLFSVAVNFSEYPFSRVLASLYNLSFWLMGACLVLVLSNTFSAQPDPIRRFLNLFPRFGWEIAAALPIFLAYGLAGVRRLEFPSLLGGLGSWFGEAPLLQYSVNVILLSEDWFASTSLPRLNLYSPYATATGAMAALALVLLWTWAWVFKKWRRLRLWWLLALLAAAILMTLSRTTVAALVVSFFAALFLGRRFAVFWILPCAVVVAGAYQWLDGLLSWFMELRLGSVLSRFDLYEATVSQLSGIHWLFGHGIKSRTLEFALAIGSHSTYLSLLYKTGLIGLAVFILFQAYLLWEWRTLVLRPRVGRDALIFLKGIGWALIFMVLWMATEDIDAPQLLAFLYFSLVGILEGLRRDLRYGSA